MDGTVLVTRLTVEILEMLLSRQIESAFNLLLEVIKIDYTENKQLLMGKVKYLF